MKKQFNLTYTPDYVLVLDETSFVGHKDNIVLFHSVWGERFDLPFLKKIVGMDRYSENYEKNYVLADVASGSLIGHANITDCTVVLAHLPLNKSPLLEGVPVLPTLPANHDKEDEGQLIFENAFKSEIVKDQPIETSIKRAKASKWFYIGYSANPAKYTEEQMRLAFDAGWTLCNDEAHDRRKLTGFNEWISFVNKPVLPTAFEAEMEEGFVNSKGIFAYSLKAFEGNIGDPITRVKTTFTSGQTQWVGRYIFNEDNK